jgi:aquaporin Z
LQKYLTEFLGSFFFVLTIGLVATSGSPLAPLTIGFALMVVVYMGGHISGGHYNPAVTLAVYLRGKLPARDVAPYMLAQIAGAAVGAYLSYMLLDRTFAPVPGPLATTVTATMVEIVYTGLLALVVLNVATSPATEGNSYYGLAIGTTIVIAVYAGGPISGGAYNPAVATGSILVHAVAGDGNFGNLWIYLLGPFAGGALASVIYKLQHKAP